MLPLASDADVHGDIIRDLRRRLPVIDLVRAKDALPEGTSDSDVLAWAAAENRVLITNDRNTMVGFAYQCVTAKDGLDAISRAIVEAPDLVLMDVVMPRMNGFEACKRMRLEASLRETPIILVTTRGEEEYVEAGFQSGCSDYITKPIDSFELVTLLRGYLGE